MNAPFTRAINCFGLSMLAEDLGRTEGQKSLERSISYLDKNCSK